MTNFSALFQQLSDNDPDSPNSLPFWDDPHIARQMLAAHLDPVHDAASRRPEHIESTLAWLHDTIMPGLPGQPTSIDIMDLGCGPGLYSQRLAQRGHRVTGMDLSAGSLAYARTQARIAGLSIDYRCQSYLSWSETARYDLVMMIYCDLGALTRPERSQMLTLMHQALRPGGRIVFDVFGPGFAAGHRDTRQWASYDQGGFWRPKPHLLLEGHHHHPDRQVITRRYLTIDAATGRTRLYRLRDYYFNDSDLVEILESTGFTGVRIDRGVIGDTNFAQGEVLFVSAAKPA